MTVLMIVACDGRSGTCPRRRVVPMAPDATAARAKTTAEGWLSLPGMDYCPDCKIDPAAAAPAPAPTRRLSAVPPAPVPGPVGIVESGPRCARCEDGDHQLCHKPVCHCTATIACGGHP